MRLIVTAMKNEGPFILEWAAHHLALGVDRFLVYTNDCEDGTDAIWARLAEMGLADHVANDKIKARGVQKTALMRADRHPSVKRAEWLGCLDVDEFLNIRHGEGRLDDLFAATSGANLILMAWRRFGAGRVIQFRDAPVTGQFTRAAPEVCPYPFHNYGFKSLWRADGPWGRMGVHRPLDLDPARAREAQVVNAAGRRLKGFEDKRLWLTAGLAGYEGGQVNHYSLRSAESFLAKCLRGLPNSKITKLDLGYWAERNFNAVEDRTILDRPATVEGAARLATLKEDAVLSRLHDAACDWHRAKIAEALADRDLLRLFLRLVVTESAVLPPAAAAALNPLVARSWEADRAHRRNRRGKGGGSERS